MMNSFKTNWKNIKSNKRIEIHINSISYKAYKNSTIEKYTEKENIQFSRIMSLADPNLEIIYIAPFKIEDEILTYYVSILKALGVERIRERLTIIVPEMALRDNLPLTYSLSQLLFLSDNSLNRIRQLIENKNCYIIPGTPSKIDIQLSMKLNCPIMMDNYEQTNALFCKSGSKRIFELSGLALPLSAWDIKSEDEFINSFLNLIRNYININVWVFKIDNEHASRGIAYINLEKIPKFNELRKERINNIEMNDKLFEDKMKNLIQKVNITTHIQ